MVTSEYSAFIAKYLLQPKSSKVDITKVNSLDKPKGLDPGSRKWMHRFSYFNMYIPSAEFELPHKILVLMQGRNHQTKLHISE